MHYLQVETFKKKDETTSFRMGLESKQFCENLKLGLHKLITDIEKIRDLFIADANIKVNDAIRLSGMRDHLQERIDKLRKFSTKINDVYNKKRRVSEDSQDQLYKYIGNLVLFASESWRQLMDDHIVRDFKVMLEGSKRMHNIHAYVIEVLDLLNEVIFKDLNIERVGMVIVDL